MSLTEMVMKSMKTAVVAREILCPIMSEVLDVDTAVFFVDADGDPTWCISPLAWEKIQEHEDSDKILKRFENLGRFVPKEN